MASVRFLIVKIILFSICRFFCVNMIKDLYKWNLGIFDSHSKRDILVNTSKKITKKTEKIIKKFLVYKWRH